MKTGPNKIPPFNGFDPGVLVKILLKNWYIFATTIALAIVGARIYIGHTLPVYKVSTSVLIYEDDGAASAENEELLQGLGLPGGMRNLDNQMMILTSRELTARALRGMNFELEYYYKTKRNDIALYPKSPAKLVYKGELPIPRNVEFIIDYLGEGRFNLLAGSNIYKENISFGDEIELENGNAIIECIDIDWFEVNREVSFAFMAYSSEQLVRFFNGRISVDVVAGSGSVLEISISGTNRASDVDFLNRLTAVFQSHSLEKKNLEAIRRIQFIDDQLVGISDSLVITENQLQQFRSYHRVMDLSIQGQAIISQVTELESEKSRLKLEANYYEYLADYLKMDVAEELPLPISMGIEDEALTGLVTELADLQEQLSGTGGGEKNPIQNMLIQRINTKKDELMETINGLRRANSLAQRDNQEQISRVNSQASALPVTERQLLGIERKFRINDDLYTFLLQKRSELQMQKASNRPDNEVIDPASVMYSSVISPNPSMINFIGLFMGTIIPLVILFLITISNKKIGQEDIDNYGDIPIIGNIPRVNKKSILEVLNNPNSVTSESYRLMRSRMQFITKDAVNPVLLVTSPMPADGKTFISINLASVYSLLGKKTLLVGFDLRNPKLNSVYKDNGNKGLSTFLIGKDDLENVVYKTEYDNLYILPSGPVPPNPSELAASSVVCDLFDQLKLQFDYIIVDSAPFGLISDTHHLIQFADATLMVVRLKNTMRDMMHKSLMEYLSKENNNLALVVNEVSKEKKKYGYGKKYGYLN